MPDIVAVGEVLVEVMRTERDVPLDRPAPLSGPYPSGAPGIFASAAARLGANVGLVGTLGRDALGDCVWDRLHEDGIDCGAVRRTDEALTGIAFVAYRSDGGRSFVFHLPQSAAALVCVDQLPRGYLERAHHAHIMGSSLCISDSMRETCYHVARTVHAQGGTVSLDPNLRPELLPVAQIRAVCDPILRIADWVFPSGEELAALLGCDTPEGGARQLLQAGVRVVALKLGERGSMLCARDGVRVISPFAVEEVDPTGAGDCFDAALIVGLLEGWPLDAAGPFANAVGALATTRLGPMEGTFGREQVLAFMASQGRPLSL